MNKEFITAEEIADIVKEFGGPIEIYRDEATNEFGESIDQPTLITTVLGYFYEKSGEKNIVINISGEIVKNMGVDYKLMLAKSLEAEKIKVGDRFTYNNFNYKIVDLGAFETSYFEMFCERL